MTIIHLNNTSNERNLNRGTLLCDYKGGHLESICVVSFPYNTITFFTLSLSTITSFKIQKVAYIYNTGEN